MAENKTTSSPTAAPKQAPGVSKGGLPPVSKEDLSSANRIEVASPAATNQSPQSPQFDMRPPKFWLVLGLFAVLVLVVAAILYFGAGKSKDEDGGAGTNLEVSTPVPGENPSPPPAVAGEDDKKTISEYFTSVSSVYKEEYLPRIPQVAVDAFKKYQGTQGDEKLDAARSFFIYLNAPGVSAGDPLFEEFAEDVKEDLEKTLGRTLF